ncbi:MAG TPA: choice-of-anchor L domain-containing protein, partial [Burkholderiales bacterium]|nr:choice-of-anchor L domain-containing protein [Burkholderiales bacterium]
IQGNFMKLKSVCAALAAFGVVAPAHAVLVTNTTDASTLVNAIIGPGITVVGTPTLTFDTVLPAGTFTGGATSVGFESGIVLTTGTTACVPGPNNQGGCGASGTSTRLTFNFTSTTGQLFFNYVFGSEEYTQFVGSQFNDTFSLLLNGTNIALLPGGGGAVSINNVNCTTNSAFYRNNVAPGSGESNNTCPSLGLDVQYDGLTTVLTATANLQPGTNTFEFFITDQGDAILDSGVFIQGASFAATPPPNGGSVPEPGSLALASLGLLAGAGLLRRRKLS